MSDGFEVIRLSISTPWFDFLPGAASKSIWAEISYVFRFYFHCGVHVPNLNCQDLGVCGSAGALALHAQIFLAKFYILIMILRLAAPCHRITL